MFLVCTEHRTCLYFRDPYVREELTQERFVSEYWMLPLAETNLYYFYTPFKKVAQIVKKSPRNACQLPNTFFD